MNNYIHPLPPLIRENKDKIYAAQLIAPVPGMRIVKEWRGYICYIQDVYEPGYRMNDDGTFERIWTFRHRTESWLKNDHVGRGSDDCEICKKYKKFWKKYKQPKDKIILTRRKLEKLLNDSH